MLKLSRPRLVVAVAAFAVLAAGTVIASQGFGPAPVASASTETSVAAGNAEVVTNGNWYQTNRKGTNKKP
ncbi:MAG: hypothetical protein ACRCZF_13010 [Gemmataceae bacterium]